MTAISSFEYSSILALSTYTDLFEVLKLDIIACLDIRWKIGLTEGEVKLGDERKLLGKQ